MREAAQLAKAKDTAENGDTGRCFCVLLCIESLSIISGCYREKTILRLKKNATS